MHTANTATERTSCCNAQATYDEYGDLYCKACYEIVVWTDDSEEVQR